MRLSIWQMTMPTAIGKTMKSIATGETPRPTGSERG